MKINYTLIKNLPRHLREMLIDMPHSDVGKEWKKLAIEKLYALFVTLGGIVFIIGMVASYIEDLTGALIFLTIVYGSGAIVFLSKWTNPERSLTVLIFYLYVLGNGLMYFCTSDLFGIFWIFIVPVLAAMFYGKFQGILNLGLSLIMVTGWAVASVLGYLRWDIGAEIPITSWGALIGVIALASLSLIITSTSLIDSYSKLLHEKQMEHDDLLAEKSKLALTNRLLEHEIENTIRLEEEKKKSEERFRQLFDIAQDMYVLHDIEGNIIDVNKETLSKLKYSKAELINPESQAAVLSNLKLTKDQVSKLTTSEKLLIEGFVYNYEGKPTPVEFNNKILQLGDSKVIFSIIRDISQRVDSEKQVEKVNKELQIKVLERTAQFDDAMQELRLEIKNRLNTEAELRKTQKKLEQSLNDEKQLSEMKTRFVSMISHEYRTPLTIIYTCSDILEYVFQKQNKELFDKNIGKIKRSVNAMINLLEDVLVIGRGEVKQIETTESEFEVIDIIQETIEELEITDNYEHKFSLMNNTDNSSINSDIKLFQYIIRNLITNAQKYSPVGSTIFISIDKVTDSINANEKYKIRVVDEGIGIPKDEIENLFEPFYRSSNVDARSGTGLGLAICKQYADAIGGELSVESELNKGSIFTLELPIS